MLKNVFKYGMMGMISIQLLFLQKILCTAGNQCQSSVSVG